MQGQSAAGPVITSLRQATSNLHRRIEQRFDAVAELAEPSRRPGIVRRYAAFYYPAHRTLAGDLETVHGLDYNQRSALWRAALSEQLETQTLSVFPRPSDRSEALGLYYVVEGSMLGGRYILRQLRLLGVEDAGLSFLDPYGSVAGSMWRSLIGVLEREGARDPAALERMCRGAARGFLFAERVLCGDVE